MLQFKAQLNYLRISPRKVRLAADLIRGLNVSEAEQQLRFCAKRSAKPLLKLLKSAIANAKNASDLYISEIRVNPGPTLKRWRARARGTAAMIRKRTSHIIIILEQNGAKSKS
ncbi:MAG: 50S ribosomal protein L22 [bacterium]